MIFRFFLQELIERLASAAPVPVPASAPVSAPAARRSSRYVRPTAFGWKLT